MKKKNGFTLIELLAVIIILGVLMIIAVPAVTKYINDSKKTSYIDTAKSIVTGVRNAAYSASLDMLDQNTTYYIPAEYVQLENGLKGPYGDFTEAYVGVTVTNDGYNYYWISRDETGTGIRDITPIDKLSTNNLETDIPVNEVITTIERTGIGNRKNIKIYDINSKTWNTIELSNLSNNVGDDGGEFNIVIYPRGKNKSSVVIGDLVTIGTEDFYVVNHDGDDLVLLSRYNLNVGENKKEDVPEGIQNSEVRGYLPYAYYAPAYGMVSFSSTNYWDGKIGIDYEGNYCTTYTSGSNCAYIYDSNSILYQYVEAYKTYLEGFGGYKKNARLLKLSEAYELGCSGENMSCENAPAWVYNTSFWLGTAYNEYNPWRERAYDTFYNTYFFSSTHHGVRPVIII